jgi:methyl acetate hydrolase
MSDALASRLDSLLERAVADEVLPGLVAIVLDRDRVLYQGAFGVSDTAAGTPMEPDATFAIGSFTKLVSAVALLRFVERGLVGLETPVGDLVPAFDELWVLEGFDGDKPIRRAPVRRATVRHLLTHTSGLAFPTWNARLMHYLEVCEIPLATLAGSRRVFEMPLVCDPGTRFNYGISGDWVGLVIEVVSGRRFEDVIREDVIAPMGLRDTVVTRTADQAARAVSLHARDGQGRWAPIPGSYYGPGVIEPEVYPAGGCLYSTALDFGRFQQLLLCGGARDGVQLLRPETVEQIFANQIGALDIGLMRTQVPAASADVPLQGRRWGLGASVSDVDRPHRRSPGSIGWLGGWNTYYWVDRARGLVAGFYSQTAPFYDPAVIACVEAFEAAVSV